MVLSLPSNASYILPPGAGQDEMMSTASAIAANAFMHIYTCFPAFPAGFWKFIALWVRLSLWRNSGRRTIRLTP